MRSDAFVNFDLNTNGTSAILPPAENNNPSGPNSVPANEDAELLWGTDLDFRLDPTIHITESLRLHIESELLDNVVFGSLSDQRLTGARGTPFRPDPSRTVFDSNQLPPREREWFENSLRINEAWGEVDTFLGEFRAGRMDNHWGLGMHANDGDCLDCDFGDHVDRIRFLTKPFGFYASAAIDFPDQGPTSQAADRIDGQPYDLSQIDDSRQYTFSIFRKPRSDKDKKIQQQRLKDEKAPVINGGARFTMRNQQGLSVPASDPTQPSSLVYRGLSLYVPDIWAQFLYAPDPNTYVRVGVEGVGVFGDIDNVTTQPVGQPQDDEQPINCFDDAVRDSNPARCTQDSDGNPVDEGISEFGIAAESELYLGGPVRFGLDGGYASGGDTPNWGYPTASDNRAFHGLDFYRFDPNYHVDLILFREVIGTVTNAYYFKPWAQARFFESPDQRMEVQLDAIASRVANTQGTPAANDDDGWLGLELDAAVRYLQIGTFHAGLEGGILFPFDALGAELGDDRLTRPGQTGGTFSQNADPDIAWTVQGNLIWQF